VISLLLFLMFAGMLFVLLNLMLLPLHFTVQSLVSLMTIPAELYRIATNPRLRRNHALEHATINVIEEHYGPVGLAGLAREDGFLIRGPADPALIEEAARVGLARLAAGESRLAIHQRCGTSVAAAHLLSAVVFLFLLLLGGWLSLFTVIMAVLVAGMVGPVAGVVMQRYLTTSTDVGGLTILGVEYERPVFNPLELLFGGPVRPTLFFVRVGEQTFWRR